MCVYVCMCVYVYVYICVCVCCVFPTEGLAGQIASLLAAWLVSQTVLASN